MSLLNSNQRAVIRVDTKIHPLIVDRVTEAFDALIERGDVDTYKHLVATAISQMGYEGAIPEADRPTPVDKMKTILLKAYADQKGITFREANKRIRKMLEGS